jgi:hypothetical protein
VLIEIYESFRRENAAATAQEAATEEAGIQEAGIQEAAAQEAGPAAPARPDAEAPAGSGGGSEPISASD